MGLNGCLDLWVIGRDHDTDRSARDRNFGYPNHHWLSSEVSQCLVGQSRRCPAGWDQNGEFRVRDHQRRLTAGLRTPA
jgi:hypothetical protein